MNRKFVVSAVTMFVLAMVIGFVVHAVMLHGEYAKLPNLMRTEADAQQHFGYLIFAHVLFALGFTWIYLQGRSAAKHWVGQGVRFGLAIAVLTTIPTYLIYFTVMPFPSDLVAQQIVLDSIGVVLLALVLAWMNR